MSNKSSVVGVDIGTTSCKTLAIDERGEVLAVSREEYPVYNPFPGWSEQNPRDWWNAVKKTLREVSRKLKEKGYVIEGLGLTGQMHGLVVLDSEGEVLRPCIMWNDQRSAPYCSKIYEIIGGEKEFLKRVNNSMLPGYTGGKILWLRENEPQVYEKAKQFLCPKDFIRYKLSNTFATDVTDASGTGLFDVKRRKWANQLIAELKIPFEMLPSVYESHEKTGMVLKDIADEIEVLNGTPVFAGGGDAVVQTIGVGAVEPNILSITLGTAGIVAVSLNTCLENPGDGAMQFFCNAIPDGWIVFGTTLAAGGSLRWFKDIFGGPEVEVSKWIKRSIYDLLGDEGEASAPYARGIVFLPYLIGERCPHNDPDARGVFIGIGLHHSRNDIVRSVYEGIVFSLRDVYSQMERLGLKISQIRISGGGARSRLFKKLHADIFNSEVMTMKYGGEGGSYGAAILAGVGAGFWSSVKEAAQYIAFETTTKADINYVNGYQDLFKIYKSLYKTLHTSFKTLKSFQSEQGG